ncbi:ATPase [Octadecabacter sp.]|nr:ATPase [Octadecabacter sp.]
MIYNSASDWTTAAQKRVLIFAMSGLGKTHVSNMLRETGDWFHYSVDYRIGTRYMGEFIADNAKAEAMKVPFLRDLLLSDSIHIASNITFDNLTPVSTYLGKPGDPARGGLPMAEYQRRQDQFRRAEIDALRDTPYFMDRAARLYNYPHFVCDTGGSICEWVDSDDPADPILRLLSDHALMVWIKGSDDHTADLVQRFDKAPKPMAYQPEFLLNAWREYLSENDAQEGDVDPDAFIRWTYARALAHRQPRYAVMAKNWGVMVDAADMATVRDEADFTALIAAALAQPV